MFLEANILCVINLPGHKNIKNTLVYAQLVNLEEEDELIEQSFEHNGVKFFRKRE
ncbi:MAG: hypothetical protein QW468_05685 [Candidatus Bathyarchaeia archaeon]